MESPQRPRKVTPAERRKLVALGIQAGKSNRAIAQELKVDEGTVRRDLTALGMEANQKPSLTRKRRPSVTLRQGAGAQGVSTTDRAIYEITAMHLGAKMRPKPAPPRPALPVAKVKQDRLEGIVAVASEWVLQQQLGSWSTKQVLQQAREHLDRGNKFIDTLPEPSLSPPELLRRTRPKQMDTPEPENVGKMEQDHALWLARWLAACLPRDEQLRTKVMDELRRRLPMS